MDAEYKPFKTDKVVYTLHGRLSTLSMVGLSSKLTFFFEAGDIHLCQLIPHIY